MFKRNLLTTLAVLALSISFAMPASAEMYGGQGEKANADTLAKIEAFLDSSQFIASRQELKELDADPVPELISLAEGRKTSSLVKDRAIKCLSLFRDARVQKSFSKLLKQSRGKGDFKIIAMSYLEAFGEEAVDDLTPYLTSKKPEVRAAVARGFGMFGGQKGYDLLRDHTRTETDAKVLQAMRPFVQ